MRRSEPVFYVAARKPKSFVKGGTLSPRDLIIAQLGQIDAREKAILAKGPPTAADAKTIADGRTKAAPLRAQLKALNASMPASAPPAGIPELVDLSQSVLSFEYEESEKKTDMCKITLENNDLRWFDTHLMEKGTELVVTWGYIGLLAPLRECIIQGVKGGKTLNIEAHSKGVLLNKIARTRTFENVTRAEVARKIASEQGYGPESQFIDDGPPRASKGGGAAGALSILSTIKSTAESALTADAKAQGHAGLSIGQLVQNGKFTGVAASVFATLQSLVDSIAQSVLKGRPITKQLLQMADVAQKGIPIAGAAAKKPAPAPQGSIPRYTAIVQAGQTDAQFLKRLADLQGFEFFIDFDGFHWHPRKVQQKPVREFTYYTDSTGEIKDFSIENDITAKPGATTVVGKDPITKQPIQSTANNETPRPVLAPVTEMVDPQTGQTTLQANAASSEVKPTTEPTAQAATTEAAGHYTRTQQSAVMLDLEMVGDPRLVAKTVIKVNGLGKRLSGRYYIFEISHKLGKGYEMSVKTRSDGMNAHGSVTQPKGAGQVNTGNPDASSGGGALTPVESVDPQTGQTKIIYKDTGGKGLDQPATTPSK